MFTSGITHLVLASFSRGRNSLGFPNGEQHLLETPKYLSRVGICWFPVFKLKTPPKLTKKLEIKANNPSEKLPVVKREENSWTRGCLTLNSSKIKLN